MHNLEEHPSFPGLIPDPRTDEQKALDYQQAEVYSASPISWVEKIEFRNFPIRNQNGSGMCVAFSSAKALGVNNLNETGEYSVLSPRDIYTRRTNTGSGMWLQNAGAIVKTYGATLDSFMPSDLLSELQANNHFDRTSESAEVALKYKALGYVFIPNDVDVMDNIAQMINEGYTPILTTFFHMSEWTDEPRILVPQEQANNFHAITVVDYFLKNDEKYLVIEDSWGQEYGNNGRRILSETWIRARMTGCMYLIDWKFEPSIKPKYAFKKVLLYGQRNPDIKALQDVLKYEQVMPSNISSTGYYGNITAKGVKELQIKYAIAPIAEINALAGKRVGIKSLAFLNLKYN